MHRPAVVCRSGWSPAPARPTRLPSSRPPVRAACSLVRGGACCAPHRGVDARDRRSLCSATMVCAVLQTTRTSRATTRAPRVRSLASLLSAISVRLIRTHPYGRHRRARSLCGVAWLWAAVQATATTRPPTRHTPRFRRKPSPPPPSSLSPLRWFVPCCGVAIAGWWRGRARSSRVASPHYTYVLQVWRRASPLPFCRL